MITSDRKNKTVDVTIRLSVCEKGKRHLLKLKGEVEQFFDEHRGLILGPLNIKKKKVSEQGGTGGGWNHPW